MRCYYVTKEEMTRAIMCIILFCHLSVIIALIQMRDMFH